MVLYSKKARISTVSFIIGMFFLSVAAQSAFACDWPYWRGPDYNATSGESGWLAKWPADGPKILWKNNVGTGFSAFAISKGKAYITGNTGSKSTPESQHMDILYCFDAGTGKIIWKQEYQTPLEPKYYDGGTLASPTVSAGKVYTVNKVGKAYCFNAETGAKIWEKDLVKEYGMDRSLWGISGSPVIIDNMVIYNVGDWGLALDKSNAKLIWKTGTENNGYSSPVPFTLDGKDLIAVFGYQGIAGLVASTGQKLWEFPWETDPEVNAADPVISGNKIFITSGYGKGCGLIQVDNNKVSQIWKSKEMRSHMSGPVLYKGYLYGFDDDKIACLEFNTGDVQWTDKSTGKGSLMLADGKLIVISEEGNLMIAKASPKEFKVISEARVLRGGTCWTMPVLANGRIYVRNSKGDVACVDVKGS
ncbi:MAG: PQQ-binding-like beta-propeller repeat protein [Planctomycetota bacterium]|jgi:outer membrane protein assembly factor BamB